MTGWLRWWSFTAGNYSAELNTPDWRDLFFFWNKWTERSGKPYQCSVLSLRQKKLDVYYLFFYLYYWFWKLPENRHSNMPVMNRGKKQVTVLAVRNGTRLQACSHIKAIDFSWWSQTSVGEGGQQPLHKKKWWYEAGCVYKLKRYLRRDMSGSP